MTAPDLRSLLAGAPVLPIIRIEDRSVAVDLAHALVEGGVRVFEIVLRTAVALDAISDIRRAVPEATVGAGTLLGEIEVRQAVEAGAQFGVSPGLTDDLAQAAGRVGLPLLPGVHSPSDVMHALRHGLRTLKLFPAHGLQGAAQIEQLQGVFPDVRFCPTGGIKPEHIPRYLSLPGCLAVGGSWVTPAALLTARDWAGVCALAKQAAGFAQARPAAHQA